MHESYRMMDGSTHNYDIFCFVLVSTEETEYYKDEVEEVGDDG